MIEPTLITGDANAVVGVDEPLIGTRSQYVEVGLLGARTAAVLQRIIDGVVYDDYDRTVVSRAASMLRDTANAVEFVSSHGEHGSQPQSYSFSAVSLTLQATTTDQPDEGVVQSLRSLADALSSVAESHDLEVAASIMPFFSTLANIARTSAGSPGDSILFSRFNGSTC